MESTKQTDRILSGAHSDRDIPVKRTFPVLNMSCASCAASAESAVKASAGVVNASVNFATATLKVDYLPDVINPVKLREIIRAVGYDLLLEDESTRQKTLETIRQKKFSELTRKTLLAGVLSLPVIIIGMFFMNMPYANGLMWLFATPVVLWLGKDFFINAWKQARHRSVNMDTLVALSTGTAYLFSTFNLFFTGFWHRTGIHAPVYFEAAAGVITFVLLGKLLEEKAKGNTSAAIKNLMGLRPKKVMIIAPDGTEKQVAVEDVQVNDTVVVKPGEQIAADGLVAAGSSYVIESMLTGEPVPVRKAANDKVFAGTINQHGSFRFKAEKVGKDTLLSQIIRMVQDAQGSKAPLQKLADRIAGIFVPAVLGIAILTGLVWIVFAGDNGFAKGLLAAITVLVIACPCALGLATPTAIM